MPCCPYKLGLKPRCPTDNLKLQVSGQNNHVKHKEHNEPQSRSETAKDNLPLRSKQPSLPQPQGASTGLILLCILKRSRYWQAPREGGKRHCNQASHCLQGEARQSVTATKWSECGVGRKPKAKLRKPQSPPGRSQCLS